MLPLVDADARLCCCALSKRCADSRVRWWSLQILRVLRCGRVLRRLQLRELLQQCGARTHPPGSCHVHAGAQPSCLPAQDWQQPWGTGSCGETGVCASPGRPGNSVVCWSRVLVRVRYASCYGRHVCFSALNLDDFRTWRYCRGCAARKILSIRGRCLPLLQHLNEFCVGEWSARRLKGTSSVVLQRLHVG